MTIQKKTKIAAIFYAVIILVPSFLALPSVYHGKGNITVEGEVVDGGWPITLFVAGLFLFMWVFTTFVTYMLLEMREKKKK